MKNNYISLSKVFVYYDNICVLEDISFQIKNNEFITIFGPNGAGKSTLIKTIIGIVKPSEGEIHIDSNIKFGYIPQQIIFNRQTPVNTEDVVISGTLPKGIKPFHKYSQESIQKADEVMKKLRVYEYRKKHIGSLSGGQLQKALIARALVNNPDVIILDEPFNGLDYESKKENLEILKTIKGKRTAILITHDKEKAVEYSDKILCLNRKVKYFGKIEADNQSKIFNN